MSPRDRKSPHASGVDQTAKTQRPQLDASASLGSSDRTSSMPRDESLSPVRQPLHPLLVRARAASEAYRAAEAEVTVILRQIGLSTAKFLVLEALSRAPRDGITMQELSRFLGTHRTSASAVVDCLIGLGWICKSQDRKDGRRTRLSISEAGEQALREAQSLLVTHHPQTERRAGR